MNIIDYAILIVLGVTILYGIYRGFVVSVLKIGAFLLSLIIAFIGYTPLARFWAGTELRGTLLYFIDGTEKIAEQQFVHYNLAQVPATKMSALIDEAYFPEVIEDIVRSNIANEVFSPDLTTMSEYINNTLANILLSTLSFIALFFVAYFACIIILSIVNHMIKLPVLVSMDGLLGGVFGGVLGLMLLFVLFLVVPPVLAVVPIEMISDWFAESRLASFFLNTTFLTGVFRGVIP